MTTPDRRSRCSLVVVYTILGTNFAATRVAVERLNAPVAVAAQFGLAGATLLTGLWIRRRLRFSPADVLDLDRLAGLDRESTAWMTKRSHI